MARAINRRSAFRMAILIAIAVLALSENSCGCDDILNDGTISGQGANHAVYGR